MKPNCLFCIKNPPKFGKFCDSCIGKYTHIVYEGQPLCTLFEKYPYIDFHQGLVKEVINPQSLRYDLFLSRNLPKLTYADERTLCYGHVIDLDIDLSLKILNFICLIPHTSLLSAGRQYGELQRKLGVKKTRHVLLGDSGDFKRMSTDFIRYETGLGAISGHSGFVGGEYSAFSAVAIPFSLFESFMISKGSNLLKGWMERKSYQRTLESIYQHIKTSILYISTKISTNYLRNEFAKLFEDPNYKFEKGFLRKFFSKIINKYITSSEKTRI